MLAGTRGAAAAMIGGICRGEHLMSYAPHRGRRGSDAAAMTTRYERDGDGFVLERHEALHHRRRRLERVRRCSRRATRARARKGVSAFLVMRDDPGVSFGEGEQDGDPRLADARGRSSTRRRIPADRLIGDEGEGFSIAMRTLDYSRPVIAAQALGIAQGALDFAASLRERARAVRQADRRVPGHPVHARRHGDAARGRARARRTARSRRATRAIRG